MRIDVPDDLLRRLLQTRRQESAPPPSATDLSQRVTPLVSEAIQRALPLMHAQTFAGRPREPIRCDPAAPAEARLEAEIAALSLRLEDRRQLRTLTKPEREVAQLPPATFSDPQALRFARLIDEGHDLRGWGLPEPFAPLLSPRPPNDHALRRAAKLQPPTSAALAFVFNVRGRISMRRPVECDGFGKIRWVILRPGPDASANDARSRLTEIEVAVSTEKSEPRDRQAPELATDLGPALSLARAGLEHVRSVLAFKGCEVEFDEDGLAFGEPFQLERVHVYADGVRRRERMQVSHPTWCTLDTVATTRGRPLEIPSDTFETYWAALRAPVALVASSPLAAYANAFRSEMLVIEALYREMDPAPTSKTFEDYLTTPEFKRKARAAIDLLDAHTDLRHAGARREDYLKRLDSIGGDLARLRHRVSHLQYRGRDPSTNERFGLDVYDLDIWSALRRELPITRMIARLSLEDRLPVGLRGILETRTPSLSEVLDLLDDKTYRSESHNDSERLAIALLDALRDRWPSRREQPRVEAHVLDWLGSPVSLSSAEITRDLVRVALQLSRTSRGALVDELLTSPGHFELARIIVEEVWRGRTDFPEVVERVAAAALRNEHLLRIRRQVAPDESWKPPG